MTRHTALVLNCFAIGCLAAGSAVADVWDGLSQGSHDIGFETRNLTDETRPRGNDPDVPESRAVQLSIWYPAIASVGADETFAIRDYVALTAEESQPNLKR